MTLLKSNLEEVERLGDLADGLLALTQGDVQPTPALLDLDDKSYVPGHGLGLSIAQKLAHNIEGDIQATSSPDKGSTFSVRMPLA